LFKGAEEEESVEIGAKVSKKEKKDEFCDCN
jgi:hypothetical protein